MTAAVIIKKAIEHGVRLFLKDAKLGFHIKKGGNFPEQLKKEIQQNKSQIIQYFEKYNEQYSSRKITAIAPVARDGNRLPLSFAQQRLWFIDQMNRGSSEYNIPGALRIEGKFDLDAAEQAMVRIIERHEALRTIFTEQDDGPVQVIRDDFSFKLTRYDLRDLERETQEKRAHELISEDSGKVFELNSDLMVRASWLFLSDKGEKPHGILLFNMHHIASDGWSMGVLVNEFVEQYQAASTGKPDPLAPLPIQYADYAHWQRQWLVGDVLEEQLSYWGKQLEEIPEVHSLPLDYPRPEMKQYAGDIVTGQLSAELSHQLQVVARENDVTPFMLLHAAIGLVLSRHSNSDDIVIGTPVANRMQIELEPLIGFFVNTLVLRTDTNYECFQDFLAHVKQVNLDAQANQEVPFEDLVERCQVSRSTQYNPLFQILFSMDTNESGELTIPGVRFSPIGSEGTIAKFDLDISAQFADSGIYLSWTYDKSLFYKESIERLDEHLQRLLTAIAKTPNATIRDLPILSPKEIDYLINELNDTKSEYPKDKLVHELFDEMAKQVPENIAVVFEDKKLTYRELNSASNQLAHYLREQKVKVKTLVGICVERSLEMVIGIMAILKAGGAYVPLDPSYPKARLNYMLKDTKIKHLLTQSDLINELELSKDMQVTELNTEAYQQQIQTYSTNNLERTVEQHPANLAYVIYTSGSTGKPKGVMVEQCSVVSLARQNNFIDVNKIKSILGVSNFAFDGSVFDLFVTLLNGKSLVLVPQDHIVDVNYWKLASDTYDVNTVFMTTALFNQVVDGQANLFDRFEQLLFGGEQANLAAVEYFLANHPKNQLIHVYGPTETTVYATFAPLNKDNSPKLPIGQPLSNKSIYVLNAHALPVPCGSVGELYIGGIGVARGYLNRPELTRERFVLSSFYDNKKKCLYKTGDLVRHLPDGNLEFIGRIDDQVKIRGFRIELGEIEAQLSNCEGVAACLVIVREDEPEQKRLVVYLVPESMAADGKSDLSGLLKQQLRKELPGYMVPSTYVILDEFPLTPNGKIDKKMLPVPDVALLQGEYAAPETETEKTLTQIWAKLLKLDAGTLSVLANFFELGGDSILSIQLVSRAALKGLHFSVKDLFSAQTIRLLAELVQSDAQFLAPQEAVSGDMCLLPIQREFFSDETDLHHFNQSVMLTTPVDFNGDALQAIIRKLYERHDALRLEFIRDDFGREGYTWRAQHVPFVDTMLESTVVVKEWDDTTFGGIESYVSEIQQSLRPDEGILFRAVYIKHKGEPKNAGRLLLVIHHLVTDGVSWRVLLEDLERLYSQWQAKEELSLPAKTSSFQQWGSFLSEYAQSELLFDERDYWLGHLAKPVAQLCDSTDNNPFPTGEGVGVVNFNLDKALTEQLLSQSNRAYRTQINELLLSGLLSGIQRWRGERAIRIDLEGHGRESLSDSLDLSQTVGWFTTAYPLTLNCSVDDSLAEVICAVKEQYRGIPNNGIGFGVLKHLTQDEAFKALPTSELVFNYLGQFDQVVNTETHFGGAGESSGDEISLSRKASHPLSLTGMVTGGCLDFNLSFDKSKYHQATVQNLMGSILQSLKAIVAHCVATEQGCYTLSDFPLAKVSREELAEWQAGDDVEIEDLYPATGMQQGLLFHSLLDMGSYVTQTLLRFDGLDIELFKQAWQQVIQRHGIFRTAFVGLESGNTHQMVHAEVELTWRVEELAGLSEAEQTEAIEIFRLSDKQKGFTPSLAPLMRMALFNLGHGVQQLIWSHHHTLLDGWCLPLVFAEVVECYRALQADEKPQLSVIPPYRDYAVWLSKQDIEDARSFWRETLSDIEGATALPLVVNKTDIINDELQACQQGVSLSEEETSLIVRLAQSAHTTVNVIVQAAWALLLSRYSGNQQVVFGATTSGRPAELPNVERMIGLFINSVPVVVNVETDASVIDWLQQLHEQLIERESYSYLPLFEIQRLSPATQAVFDSLLVFENYPVDEAIEANISQADLMVQDTQSFAGMNYGIGLVAELSDILSIKLMVKAGLLTAQSASQIGKHLKQLLLGLAQSGQAKVDEIELLSPTETHYLIYELNNTQTEYPDDKLIHELFETQAAQHPDELALVFEDKQLTYRELNEVSNQLAHYLQEQGVSAEVFVGICVERSLEMVVGILAILKAGGAYVPLDPGYPEARLQYMLEDTALKHLLIQPGLIDELELADDIRIMELNTQSYRQQLQAYSTVNPKYKKALSASNLAYVIYTSGSTGQPKGVMVEQRSVVSLAQQNNFIDINKTKSILGASNIAFDGSVFDLFVALLNGKALVILPQNRIVDVDYWKLVCDAYDVNTFFMTTALFNQFIDEQPDLFNRIDQLLIGGEQAKLSKVKYFLANYSKNQLINCYGPTETTVFATCAELNKANSAALPIGKPLSNKSIYVLDPNAKLVPPGAVGELYIGGAGVARGYLNQPELTAERFVYNPFSDSSNDRLYKTGDLVHYLADGNLVFLSRIDEQVKIRGFRIELGEIEYQLSIIDEIVSSLVLVREDDPGQKNLVAYVVPKNNKGVIESDLAGLLKQQLEVNLPTYMVPSGFVILEEFPLTPNGKIDKKALPAPDGTLLLGEYIAPETDTEKLLTQTWAKLLKLDAGNISVTSNFFELGGHSLSAVKLLTDIRVNFEVEISIHTIFEKIDLKAMANKIDAKKTLLSIERKKENVVIKDEGFL